MNETMIGKLVDRFYAKVREDDMLGPIFANAIGDGWDLHLATMRSFWCTVMLGSVSYKGNPMAVHIRLPGLGQEHFDRWLSLWRETVDEMAGIHGALFVQRAEAMAGRLLSVVTSAVAQSA